MKNAIIYGAGGAVGDQVARAFEADGIRVFRTGRTPAPGITVVDALDEAAVEAHADAVLAEAGSIDISFNATSLPQAGIQGTRPAELSVEAFERPLAAYPRSSFITARAAARRMIGQGSGVILTITASPSRTAVPLMGGMAPAWAAVEAMSRGLAAELGPHGVRVVCLNAAGMPETAQLTEVYGLHAEAYGITGDDFHARMAERTLRKRLPTVAEIADAAVFAASDRAAAMTGAILNLTGGLIAD
ncbi:SDR family oxidoreductase [Dactylosporangium salmoneum]|uniref:SDR family oxidoreductase n=1 Tax=Dactylosporangium salmoneum TaxID=53361 RepID=A0ABN3I6C4_9ACTN